MSARRLLLVTSILSISLAAVVHSVHAQSRPSLAGIQSALEDHDRDVKDRLDALLPSMKTIAFFQDLSVIELPSLSCVTVAEAEPGTVMMGTLTLVELPPGGFGTFLSLKVRGTESPPFVRVVDQFVSNLLVRERNIPFTGTSLRVCNASDDGVPAISGAIVVLGTAVQFPVE